MSTAEMRRKKPIAEVPLEVVICSVQRPIDQNRRWDWFQKTVKRWKALAEAIGGDKVKVAVMMPQEIFKSSVELMDDLAGCLGIQRTDLRLIGTPKDGFQRGRRIASEILATMGKPEEDVPDFHVVADDDCLLQGGPVALLRAVDVMYSRREFAILTPMPSNANIYPWRPGKAEYGRLVVNDPEVMEHVDVGGIRFTRTGIMSVEDEDWRAAGAATYSPVTGETTVRYDRLHAIQLRERGQRVGYVKSVRFEHLGEINPPKEGDEPPEEYVVEGR